MVVSNWVGKPQTDRITVRAPVINNAERVIFMVAGKEKPRSVKSALEGPHEPHRLPAQLIRPLHGQLLWVLDGEAARLLPHYQSDCGPAPNAFIERNASGLATDQ